MTIFCGFGLLAGSGCSNKKPDPPNVVKEEQPKEQKIEVPLQSSPPQTPKIQEPDPPVQEQPKPDLEGEGIHSVRGTRLSLHADLEPTQIKELHEFGESALRECESYFGPLANRNIHFDGYVMQAVERFERAGVIPKERSVGHVGWHRGKEFWLEVQPTDYYTKYIIAHELVHAYMTAINPVFRPHYQFEGIAELLATYETSENSPRFRALPESVEKSPHWGRILLLHEDLDKGRLLNIDEIMSLTNEEFSKNISYAWAWAFCKFLDEHPSYQKKFRDWSKQDRQINESFRSTFFDQWELLEDEWLLFAGDLDYGYELESNRLRSIDHQDKFPVSPLYGWQSTKIELQAGTRYQVQAKGSVILANTSKPWRSEPDGISIRYYRGRRLGQLIGCIRPTPGSVDRKSIAKSFPIQSEFVAPYTGTLLLKIVDSPAERADNQGEYEVTISASK